MPRFEQHCADCLLKLGEEYKKVHLWLDEKAKEYPIWQYGAYHRVFRHNKKGINVVRKMWGEGAARAAELHIIFDMGFVPDITDMNERTRELLKAADEEEALLKETKECLPK